MLERVAAIWNEYQIPISRAIGKPQAYVNGCFTEVEFESKISTLCKNLYLNVYVIDITSFKDKDDIVHIMQYLRGYLREDVRIIVVYPNLKDISVVEELSDLGIYDIVNPVIDTSEPLKLPEIVYESFLQVFKHPLKYEDIKNVIEEVKKANEVVIEPIKTPKRSLFKKKEEIKKVEITLPEFALYKPSIIQGKEVIEKDVVVLEKEVEEIPIEDSINIPDMEDEVIKAEVNEVIEKEEVILDGIVEDIPLDDEVTDEVVVEDDQPEVEEAIVPVVNDMEEVILIEEKEEEPIYSPIEEPEPEVLLPIPEEFRRPKEPKNSLIEDYEIPVLEEEKDEVKVIKEPTTFLGYLFKDKLSVGKYAFSFASLAFGVLGYLIYKEIFKAYEMAITMAIIGFMLPTIFMKTKLVLEYRILDRIAHKAAITSIVRALREGGSVDEALKKALINPNISEGLKDQLDSIITLREVGKSIDEAIKEVLPKVENYEFKKVLMILAESDKTDKQNTFDSIRRILSDIKTDDRNISLMADSINDFTRRRIIFMIIAIVLPISYILLSQTDMNLVMADYLNKLEFIVSYILIAISQIVVDHKMFKLVIRL